MSKLDWFRDARFGMFIHRGLYARPGGVWRGQEMECIGEWLQAKFRIPCDEYAALAKQFDPPGFDADAWVATACDAGMRYIVYTAKHHDGFRITVGLNKLEDLTSSDGPGFRFAVDADVTTPDGRFPKVWRSLNEAFIVPYGKWLTLETHYAEGNDATGRFSLAVTPDGGSRQQLINVQNLTHHPKNPSPSALSHFNPLKRYTSAAVVDFVRSAGGIGLQVDWAGFEIRASA